MMSTSQSLQSSQTSFQQWMIYYSYRYCPRVRISKDLCMYRWHRDSENIIGIMHVSMTLRQWEYHRIYKSQEYYVSQYDSDRDRTMSVWPWVCDNFQTILIYLIVSTQQSKLVSRNSSRLVLGPRRRQRSERSERSPSAAPSLFDRAPRGQFTC